MGYVASELPIFICDLQLIQPQLALARQAIDELRLSHPESTPSNVQAIYMSPWNSHDLNAKLQPLCDSVVTIAQTTAQNAMGVWFTAMQSAIAASGRRATIGAATGASRFHWRRWAIFPPCPSLN